MGPEAEWANETLTTLSFAQQMMQLKNVEQSTFADGQRSSVIRLQQRQQECLQQLQEARQAAAESHQGSSQDCRALESGLRSLDRQLLTKGAAAAALGDKAAEQTRLLEHFRQDVSQLVTRELASLQEQTDSEFHGLRSLLEAKLKGRAATRN
eukprot:SRR837773.16168.p2 GENE.SRR837773.16168~~SRR837773.16168.p2  ORF type:complete len:153 (-),score=51.75 SRR837773.16168:49-507(-)